MVIIILNNCIVFLNNYQLIVCNKYIEEWEKGVIKVANGYILSKGVVNSLDSYRKLEKLLTSKEIKQIRNKYKITQLEMAKLIGVGDVTVTRYETKQIQDEAHDKIMRLIDENYQMKIINLKFI